MSTTIAKAKISVPLAPEQRSDAAVAAVLRSLLEVIAVNRDGAVIGGDPEALHQLRISVRRTRAVQRQLKGVFVPVELRGFRAEFAWLQRATGETRDLDVQVTEFAALRELLPAERRDDLDPLRLVLEHWRLASQGQTMRVLRSRRTEDLLADWEMVLESLVELPVAERPWAARPIGDYSAHRVRRVYRRLLHMGRAITPESPAEDVHALRKVGKELRYLLELFAVPLHSPSALAPVIRPLKRMQDVLGRHQDREVQRVMLTALAEEVGTMPGGARAVLAMGMLLDRVRADARRARAGLAEPLGELSDQHAFVKRTFPRP